MVVRDASHVSASLVQPAVVAPSAFIVVGPPPARAAVPTQGTDATQAEGASSRWPRLREGSLVVAVALAGRARRRCAAFPRPSPAVQRGATKVAMEGPETEVPPWELDEETEEERKIRYKREAEEMKLKWDARRLEEKQSAEFRRAFAAKERERMKFYGPRDKIMEAYDARMYEEARVIEVRRRQREVYERIKAFKLGKPLPPKGEPYVPLRPPVKTPPKPEDFDVSGRYDPRVDIEEQKYRAPESYVSPTGPAPPPAHLRGMSRAAWEDEPYGPPPVNPRPAPDPPTPEEVLEEMKAKGTLPMLAPEPEAKATKEPAKKGSKKK